MGQTPETLLKLLVEQRLWRYIDFAREYERSARALFEATGTGPKHLTISESQFRRWTAGKLTGLPSADACRVLEHMFGVPVAALFKPPTTADLPTRASDTYRLEDEIEMTAREAQEEAGSAAAESVSDTTLDQLRDDVRTLARQYHSTSPFDVFRQAKTLREQAEHHRDHTQVPVQQQELLIVAGQACALLATAAFDLGSLENAARLSRSAALYGETARFEPLRAFAGGTLAYLAYFTGRPGGAVQFARAAQRFSGLGDVGRRRLFAIEARAHGHLGDISSAERALDASQAEGAGATDDLHDEVGGEFDFPPDRLSMSSSSTALLLGNAERAELAAKRALSLAAARPPAQRSTPVIAGAAADLATSRLLRSDLDGAAEALQTVWAVPPEHRATGLLERTGVVRRALAAPQFHATQLAVDLREQLEEFTRLSAPRQLGTAPVAALEA